MSKTEAENIKKISSSFLRENNYFCGWMSGNITWTRSGWGGEHKNSVSIQVSTCDEEKYLRIYYTQTDNDTGEKKDFDYKIPLTTTPCHLGGKRYWFICPWYRNGRYCGRRVGVLYKDGDYFACRHCYDITYASRNLSGRAKMFGSYLSCPELDKLREKVKKTHYKGKLTKRYSRFLRKDKQADDSFIGMALMLNRRFKKVLGGNSPLKKHKK